MKRTPFKRPTPERKPLRITSGEARLEVKVLRPKVCKACREKFTPTNSMQIVCCGVPCGVVYAQSLRAKKTKKEEVEERKVHREKLADSKKLSHWHALTERVVHAYVHARDKGLPCISCGTTTTVRWEAGHWLSKGARPELRYVADQINLQCHRCNVQLSGNQAAYRVGLVKKIGEARVQELEGPHTAAKHTREDLAAIRKHFAALARELEKQK